MKTGCKVTNLGDKEWRTFKDFVKHAQQVYGRPVLDEKEIKKFILKKLKSKGLSKIAVVCYINWCDNGFFSQQEIANNLGITQQAVADHINRLRKVWSFLPGHPHARGQRNTRKKTGNPAYMARLKDAVLHGSKIRESW